MLFSEVDDCSICPFAVGEEYADCCDHSGSPDGKCPCLNMDSLGDLEIDEVAAIIYGTRREQEDEMDRRWLKEQKQKEANKKKAMRAHEARMATLHETMRIKQLRRAIAGNNAALRMAESFAIAFNTTNQMFGYSERAETDKNNPLLERNAIMQAEIDRLEVIRKEKLRQLRMSRKSR